MVKFMFSKKATKTDVIFTVNLTLTTKRQIDGEDDFKFLGLFRKNIQSLYLNYLIVQQHAMYTQFLPR